MADQENIIGQEQILRRKVIASDKLRSDVWVHYERSVTYVEGKVVVKAMCKKCHAELLADSKRNGTSTLRRHRKSCPGIVVDTTTRPSRRHPIPRPTSPPRPRAAVAGESSSGAMKPDGHREACEDLARLVALRGYDPSFLEDDYFRSFASRLNPGFEAPSRRDVEERCVTIATQAMEDPASKLKGTRGRVSIAVGTAGTVDRQVLYKAYHFIDGEWNLRKVIENAEMVSNEGSHGPLLPSRSVDLQDKSQLIYFMCAISLRDERFSLKPDEIFSMAWRTSIYLSEPPSSRWDWYSQKELVHTEHTDDALHSIAECLGEFFFALKSSSRLLWTTKDPDDEWDYHQHPIDIIFCALGESMLPGSRTDRKELLSQLGLQDLLTYNKRWYSCYCSMEVLQKERSSTALEEMFYPLTCYAMDGSATTYQVSVKEEICRNIGEQETEFAQLLRMIWGAIYRAVETISAPHSPTSNLCLRELFKVREVVQSELERACGDNIASLIKACFDFDKSDTDDDDDDHALTAEDLQDVLMMAVDILDTNIVASYLVWSIPLILDPRYKLRYIQVIFERAYGSDKAADYISEITKKIQDVFTDYSQDVNEMGAGDSDRVNEISAAGGSSSQIERNLMSELESQLERYDQGLFQALMEGLEITPGKSELDLYLEADGPAPETETPDFDILSWWKDNSPTYPTVARMARDALAMPTCSKLSSEQTSQIKSIIRGYFTSW